MTDPALVARFMRHVQKTETCWLWTASADDDGYGISWMGQRKVRAHRVSYALFVGDPGELWVLHKCDNPSCVNPEHLFLGTVVDNAADREAKGRGRYLSGEENPAAKLTDARVITMRALHAEGVTFRQLGKMFGVSRHQASRVISGKSWRGERL